MFFDVSRWLKFKRDERGVVAVNFALTLVPIVMMAGAALDYARGLDAGSRTQSVLDSSVLSAMGQPVGARAAAAAASFAANPAMAQFAIVSQSFIEAPSGDLTGSATIAVPTTLMSAIAPSIAITRSASATQPTSTSSTAGGSTPKIDNSCILTLGEQLTVSSDVMTFNGSPAVNLTGCNLRSNKSMDCNGHSTGAQTYAVGSIVGCSYPHSGEPTTPDIYASLASNISTVCGANAGGYAWTASGALPTASPGQIIYVSRNGYTELHVCGDLTLSGTSATTLTGASPASDTVVVIENGGMIIANSSAVVASATTFVLAGGSGTPLVSWPNGNGGNASSLTLAASTSAANPWQGIAIYENPSLNLNMSWNSGVSFSLDGVLYFPNAQFTVSGQVNSGPVGCGKIVVGEFTLNGSVNMSQTSQACAAMGVSEYTFPSTTMTTTTTSTAYLTR